MRVTLTNLEDLGEFLDVRLLIERTHGKYNSLPVSAQIYKDPSLTKNQLISSVWLSKRSIALQVFNNVWGCRNSPQHPVIEDIPEFDGEGNVIWAERIDKTPVNEDTLPDALPPAEEPDEFIGFKFEALPPEPEKPYQATLEDKVTMLQATIDLLMMGGM